MFTVITRAGEVIATGVRRELADALAAQGPAERTDPDHRYAVFGGPAAARAIVEDPWAREVYGW